MRSASATRLTGASTRSACDRGTVPCSNPATRFIAFSACGWKTGAWRFPRRSSSRKRVPNALRTSRASFSSDSGGQVMDNDIIEQAIAVRRHLHRNPELSNSEVDTQTFLRQALEAAGLGGINAAGGTGL